MKARLLTKAALLLAIGIGTPTFASDSGKKTATNSDQVVDRSPSDQTAESDRSTKPSGMTSRSPRVVVITSGKSETCRREMSRLEKSDGPFSAMQSRGWKIGATADNHVQIVDESEAGDLVEVLGNKEFPLVACVEDGEVVRSFKDGCSTPLDAWTFGWLLKGVNERPQAPIPEAIRVTTTGSYPLRGNHWTVDGDSNPTKDKLVLHLRGANHVQYLNASWKIDEWSTEELRSLHDDLHEKYGPANPTNFGTTSGGSSFPDGIRKGLGK